MSRATFQETSAPLRSRWLAGLVTGVSVAILGAVVVLTTEQTRERVREQIAGRDGEVLHAVALMQQPDPGEVVGALDDPANQLVVVLQTSRLTGVMGARLFDAGGIFIEAFPEYVLKDQLDEEDLARLEALHPVSHFRPAAPPAEIFLPEGLGPPGGASSAATIPLLVVNVPLHAKGERRLLGIAQFLVQGHGIAQEFSRLDRHLIRQGLVAFLVGSAILVAAILWSFRRLARAHRMLAERTDNLVAANRELALAAKTSAVGAVTAHLLHGLKNPLAGLQNFVVGLGDQGTDQPAAELQQAIATTRRMQTMINDVVGVLREEQGGAQYEITLEELAAMVDARVRPLAARHGVTVSVEAAPPVVFANRVANLVALVLSNLVQNALEATPRGGQVRLRFRRDEASVVVEVCDEGPGFPREGPVFVPCPSGKDGGSGIGLAISKQLANHLGAGLDLTANSSCGCVFALTLPRATWARPASSVTVTLG